MRKYSIFLILFVILSSDFPLTNRSWPNSTKIQSMETYNLTSQENSLYGITKHGNLIYLSDFYADGFISYNTLNHQIKNISIPSSRIPCNPELIEYYDGKLFLPCSSKKVIFIFDINSSVFLIFSFEEFFTDENDWLIASIFIDDIKNQILFVNRKSTNLIIYTNLSSFEIENTNELGLYSVARLDNDILIFSNLDKSRISLFSEKTGRILQTISFDKSYMVKTINNKVSVTSQESGSVLTATFDQRNKRILLDTSRFTFTQNQIPSSTNKLKAPIYLNDLIFFQDKVFISARTSGLFILNISSNTIDHVHFDNFSPTKMVSIIMHDSFSLFTVNRGLGNLDILNFKP